MSVIFDGIPASGGIAIAKTFRFQNFQVTIEQRLVEDPNFEVARFNQALLRAETELEDIKNRTLFHLGEEHAAIFSAHLLILHEPEMMNQVREKIINEYTNAEFAMNEASEMFISMFEQLDDEYMKERIADIRDVRNRVISKLLDIDYSNQAMITEEVILIAQDLTPSDTAQINKKFVKGFVTALGGQTSHTAIMARSMEIPAVVGITELMSQLKEDTVVILDGFEGKLITSPSAAEIAFYSRKKEESEKMKEERLKLINERTSTIDGHHVELLANIGSLQDIEFVVKNGAEGIGLFRTEYLYMNRNQLPTEQEQFEAYRTVLEKMGNHPVIIRTIDIGGDKELPYLHLPQEMNPFLGCRAIRLCMKHPELFRTQLRALLRASVYGTLKIMFPMIATLQEFRQAKLMFEEEKADIVAKGIPIASKIELGIMIEIPAAAILADQFSKEVDFFSIGTNDLIQYTMAADRMNEQVSYLYQPYHPSILRLIDLVIKSAHQEGKWVGMCGEMASDPIAIPILLGLGLNEFSMSAPAILPARSQIRTLSKEVASLIAKKALLCKTVDEVELLIKKAYNL